MDDSLVFDRYFNLSLRYLSYRPRSEKEVYDHLVEKSKKAKGLSEKIIAEIMQRLIKLNFVDDLEFAKFWIEHRKKAFSIVKMELVRKGINNETIEKAKLSFDINKKDDDLIKKLIEKKKNLPYEKLAPYLMRRGFSYDEVRRHLKS